MRCNQCNVTMKFFFMEEGSVNFQFLPDFLLVSQRGVAFVLCEGYLLVMRARFVATSAT